MSEKDICEVPGCEQEASRITATEVKYIQVCVDCFNKRYKI